MACPKTLVTGTASVIRLGYTTCWLTVADVLLVKRASQLNEAVILWLPNGSPDVVKRATPLVRLTVPSVAAPLRNVTVPAGVPEPGAATLTVAVKVTAAPRSVGLPELASAVRLAAGPTRWLTGLEVLTAKRPSPW